MMEESKTDLNVSIAGGSDVIFDIYCQPCDSENLHTEACGYCEQCQEYLCDSCSRNHKKYAALRSHTILDTAAMSKSKIIPKVRDILTEPCQKHLDKVIEYFCGIHEELCCSVCLNTKHKECKDTAYVPDISDGTTNKQECEKLITKLDCLVTMATNDQMKLGLNERDNDAYHSKAIDNIKAFRKDVDKELDRAEEDAISKVSALNQANSDKVNSALQKYQSVLSHANAIKTDLVEKGNANKKKQLFVSMKLATHRLATIQNEIKDAADCNISRYVFNQDEKVRTLVTSLSAIWSLSVRQDGEDINAKYVGEVNVKTAEDTEDCSINGIAMLTGGRILITDDNNIVVKMIDRKLNRVTSRLQMSSQPCNLTKTEDNQVAVCLNECNKIEILKVSDIISRSRTIDLSGDFPIGLAYDGNMFFLLSSYARSIKTVDISGRVLSTVYADNDTNPLLKFPWYIALNPGKDVLYITDQHAKTVTTMTLRGKIISVCKPTKLEFPVGVTVGRDGTVFVCYNDHTVLQISATGQRVKVLLDEKQGLAPFPRAIAYDEDGNRICVSSACKRPEYRNFVRLFQLE